MARIRGRFQAAVKLPWGSPAEPNEELLRTFGYPDTPTGVTITEGTALALATYWDCVRVISEDVGSLPFPVYRQLEPRGKVRAPEHRLYGLLHDEPNPEMQAMDFREALTAHAVSWGNGYAEIERGGDGQIRALWPLRPDRMRLERIEGRLWYFYTVSGVTYPLRPEQVLHIHGLGWDGVVGYSVARIAARSLGLSAALEEYASRLFSNGAAPRGVLERPLEAKKLSDEAITRMRTQWAETYGGLSNAHRVAILEEGVSYKAVGMGANEAQMLESRLFQAVEICRWFRMQPHKVGILDRATWGNIEQQNIEHGTDTIRPWCVRWEQAIAARCFSAEERRQYVAEHVIDALLRGDSKTRHETYQIGIMSGYYSPNDVAELENRNPIPNGDQYFIPLNLIPLEQAGEDSETEETTPPPPEQAPPEIRRQRTALACERLSRAYTPAVEVALRGLWSEGRRLVMRAASAVEDATDEAAELEAAVTRAWNEIPRQARQRVEGPAVLFAMALDEILFGERPRTETEDLERREGQRVAAALSLDLAESLAELVAVIDEGPGAVERLRGLFAGWTELDRAGQLARALLVSLQESIVPAELAPAGK
jgi:HK97 family phage portal protein